MANTTSSTDTQPVAVPERVREVLWDMVDHLWKSKYENLDSLARPDHIPIPLSILRDWLGEQNACRGSDAAGGQST